LRNDPSLIALLEVAIYDTLLANGHARCRLLGWCATGGKHKAQQQHTPNKSTTTSAGESKTKLRKHQEPH